MARRRDHLRRAPIAEAVIDYRVLPQDGISADLFANLGASVGEVYDQRLPMRSIQARFGFHPERPVEASQTEAALGWMYKSSAIAAVAQFRSDGFTFSKLEKYTTWQEVFGEAERLWRLYVLTARPSEVSRVAVRYINRLRLPGPAELRDYFEAPPGLPAPMSQAITEFLMRFVINDAERDAKAIVTLALEPSIEPILPVLFDIDAYREIALPPDAPAIREIFDRLRALKNEIFFAWLTERTVEMYA